MVVRASCVQTLCKIWAKSNYPLQRYWRFSYLFRRGGCSKLYSSEWVGVDRTLSNLERTEFHHRCTNSETLVAMLLRFGSSKKTDVENDPNLALYDPCKNYGRVLYYCNTVGWTWRDWSLILEHPPSVHWHCWLGHFTRKNLSPIWPIMWGVKPYTQPINQVWEIS